jgi:hypothetical protein
LDGSRGRKTRARRKCPVVCPAGEYTDAHTTQASTALTLKAIDGGKSSFVLAQPDYNRSEAKYPMLVLNRSRYAGRNFVSEVWGIAHCAVRLYPSRTERDFASRLCRRSEEIMVAAKK